MPDRRELGEYSQLLRLIAHGRATTRATLAQRSMLSRATIAQRVDALVRSHILTETGLGPSTGGRPPVQLALNSHPVVLSADLGATHGHLAVAGLNSSTLVETRAGLDITSGPPAVLAWMLEQFEQLLREVRREVSDVLCIAVGVPGPVEFSTGRAVRPPIMPGWDGFNIREYVQQVIPAPVLVDNDVNLMALGEYWGRKGNIEHLLFVKVGTGIGCGIVSAGGVHRGADGAAGDIGHIRVSGHDDIICHCGNVGCLEAIASGPALVRALNSLGVHATSTHDVVRLGQEGHPQARRLIRLAGQAIGEVVAGQVSFYNPNIVVVGGAIAALREDLLAGIRGVVYERALPLATRHLAIETTTLEDRAAVFGGSMLASEHVLSPDLLGGWFTQD